MTYTPKWVNEALDAVPVDSLDFEKLVEILMRINTLLCIAGSETDNEFLHDDIQKEIKNVEINR